jgi:hypothetical protein
MSAALRSAVIDIDLSFWLAAAKPVAGLFRPSRDVVQVGRLASAAFAPESAAYTGFLPRRQRNPACAGGK